MSSTLTDFKGSPDNVTAAKDKDQEDEKRGDSVVSLLAGCPVQLGHPRVLHRVLFGSFGNMLTDFDTFGSVIWHISRHMEVLFGRLNTFSSAIWDIFTHLEVVFDTS